MKHTYRENDIKYQREKHREKIVRVKIKLWISEKCQFFTYATYIIRKINNIGFHCETSNNLFFQALLRCYRNN